MEPEGKHRNSTMKQRILAVFGLVEIVLGCTLTMNDFQGLMMQLEGSDNGAGSLEAPSSDPESQSWSKSRAIPTSPNMRSRGEVLMEDEMKGEEGHRISHFLTKQRKLLLHICILSEYDISPVEPQINEHASHRRAGGRRCPWTAATPESPALYALLGRNRMPDGRERVDGERSGLMMGSQNSYLTGRKATAKAVTSRLYSVLCVWYLTSTARSVSSCNPGPDLPYSFLGFSPGLRGFKGPPAKSSQ
ncbi:hypothetical protein EVAR_86580_1 [Eumeta japonica]|uniref:Uncharacterized protein n=1 Tax=Eumeta variegata TaxID=151549 RepID=A0A4C1VZT0_EUMVA|nr:hypothetical protein EVAR_86580_1 [Eumeta japonica]